MRWRWRWVGSAADADASADPDFDLDLGLPIRSTSGDGDSGDRERWSPAALMSLIPPTIVIHRERSMAGKAENESAMLPESHHREPDRCQPQDSDGDDHWGMEDELVRNNGRQPLQPC